MCVSRFVVIILVSACLSKAASAQEPVREKAPAYPTRDSLSKKAIEEKFAAEINKCRSQISTLNKEIVQLDKKIKDLQLAADQAVKDYNTWLVNYEKSPGRKDPQAISKKKYALQQKLNDTDIQIEQCKKDKKIKLNTINELQLLIAKLEKEREALLKKVS